MPVAVQTDVSDSARAHPHRTTAAWIRTGRLLGGRSGTPQVAILRDEKPNFEWLPEAEIKRQGEAAKAGKGNLWKCLNSG